MADWNAAQYLKFDRERTRAAIDLLASVPVETPRSIVDLGCGPGNSTQLLVERWPGTDIVGLDTSPDMLAKARAAVPSASFVQADVATWTPERTWTPEQTWTPERKPDLIFANAVLQWVPDHAALLPRLLSLAAPGGALAVQMPDNLDEPSHALMREVARSSPFADKLAAAAGARTALGTFEELYGWLKPSAADVDIWRTTYVHRLDGASAIVEWVKATGLRPFIDPLDEEEKAHFLARYETALATAYPRQVDGKVLLRFPRLFIVATRH